MSEQGFRGVLGVPEGWELVGFRLPKKGEWFLGIGGVVVQADCDRVNVWPIIRKIETPKKYRPFANGEEFRPHRDRWVKVVSEDNNSGCDLDLQTGSTQKVICSSENLACVQGGWLSYIEAFECFVFDDDGTPFGMEVTE